MARGAARNHVPSISFPQVVGSISLAESPSCMSNDCSKFFVDQKIGRDALERYEVLRKELDAIRAEVDRVLAQPRNLSPDYPEFHRFPTKNKNKRKGAAGFFFSYLFICVICVICG